MPRKAVSKAITQPVLTKPGTTSAYPDGKGLTKGDELLRRLQFEFGYDPLKELVKLASSNKTTSSEKIKIASEIMSYYQPKVKPMELNPNAGEVIQVNISYPDTAKKDSAASEPTAEVPATVVTSKGLEALAFQTTQTA